MATDPCMFDILALADDDLRRVLPKASTRSLAKLVVAYPRAVGRTFLEILKQCLSTPTIEFMQEEMVIMKIPTYLEIRQAELELMQIIRAEHLNERLSCAPPPPSLISFQ